MHTLLPVHFAQNFIKPMRNFSSSLSCRYLFDVLFRKIRATDSRCFSQRFLFLTNYHVILLGPSSLWNTPHTISFLTFHLQFGSRFLLFKRLIFQSVHFLNYLFPLLTHFQSLFNSPTNLRLKITCLGKDWLLSKCLFVRTQSWFLRF